MKSKAPSSYGPIEAFHRAAKSVPAYRTLLKEAGVRPNSIKTMEDFARLPMIGKRDTFQRFPIEDLCPHGRLPDLSSVLTSSGHSGIFAFGLNARRHSRRATIEVNQALDDIFSVGSVKTLLINCLPMGVKVPTSICTLAETSVRADMVVGLVKGFGRHYGQIILVGEAAFVKHTLELGRALGVDWSKHLVHVILGEEMLAENARRYLKTLLAPTDQNDEQSLVCSSMGIGEVGLNLFSEIPTRELQSLIPFKTLLPKLRAAFHEDATARRNAFGERMWVPSLFFYDPRRIFVEFDTAGRLILTKLGPHDGVPLIRYCPGDYGVHLAGLGDFSVSVHGTTVAKESLATLPIVAISGRGHAVRGGGGAVEPESVKEGIYSDPSLAEACTANFRVLPGDTRAHVRIQLSPGRSSDADLASRLTSAIQSFTAGSIEVSLSRYEDFGSGMSVDFERKFDYLGP